MATHAPLAEVALAMHETMSDKSVVFHRGTKVRKCHTSRRDTFESVNASPIARIENGQIQMLTENYHKRNSARKAVVKPDFDEKVALIKFHPNFNPQIIDWCVNEGCKGIVLEGTGLGHVGNYCLGSIRKAIEKDIIVAMASQCIWGRVDMNVYDQGRDLLAMGVIPLEDMLAETALVKLMWIFGQTKKTDEAEKLLIRNIANEISPRTLPE
jgi:glutamyl-tRNA(Gln) amidotransferase subunit D